MEEKNKFTNKTAAITGAASGIGAAYAKKLASLNYDLLLIDKDKEGLKKTAQELKKNHRVEIGIITADLSKEKDIDAVAKKLNEIKISLLVNNAGFGIAHSFSETEPELLGDMIKVHVESTVKFTRAVLPKMMEAKEGTIINVSSIAVFFKNRKNNTIYESTKNFMLVFSEALAKEIKNYNIKIQVICPGYTRTNFMNSPTIKGRDYSMIPDWMWMTPEEVVEESLNKIRCKKIILIPGRVNKMIVCLLRSKILSWIPNAIVSRKKKQ